MAARLRAEVSKPDLEPGTVNRPWTRTTYRLSTDASRALLAMWPPESGPRPIAGVTLNAVLPRDRYLFYLECYALVWTDPDLWIE